MMRLRRALLTQKMAAPIGNRNIPSEFGSKPYERSGVICAAEYNQAR